MSKTHNVLQHSRSADQSRKHNFINQVLASSPDRQRPSDPEDQNDDRSMWAQAALQTFAVQTGSDLGDCVSDLIADLAHFCDRHGLNLASEIKRAEFHYDEETANEGKQFEL